MPGYQFKGGAKLVQQRFDASGSFTVPAGVYELFCTAAAGGGGGGGQNGGGQGAGGGGGGGTYCEDVRIPVTPGDVLTITIGAGGAGGGVGANGANGTPTQITGAPFPTNVPFWLAPGRGGGVGGAPTGGSGGGGGDLSQLATA